jgi:fructose-1,6-bisphosphatase I
MSELNLMPQRGVTLTQHLTHQQKLARASGEFSTILAQISLAGKVIARALSQAGLFDRGGYTGTVNVQGEQQKKLDLLSNETFIKVFSHSPSIATLVSEEMEAPRHLHSRSQGGKYVVCVDPLDGSSNLDVNGVVGSIFSVLRRVDLSEQTTSRDMLQKGIEQVAAGYIMYGPATVLVYTIGNGVNAYTLDNSIGEFLITKEDIHIPERGLTYACNEAHYHEWHDSTRRFIEHLRTRDSKTGKHYSTRYAGSLIADFHRTLLEGGVYLYPPDADSPATGGGKLRLMYECNPLAMIAEQAGGKASDGEERILKLQPEELHQRCPLIIGSPYEVLLYEDFVRGRRKS